MSDLFRAEAPFSPLEKQILQPLLSVLTLQQKQWLSRALLESYPDDVLANVTLKPVSIYYGTESGNSEELAARLGKQFKKAGHATKVRSLGDVNPSHLVKDQVALFVVSTWGDGEPPEAAVGFFKELSHLPRLEKLEYAVCALGDSSYEKFCQAGKDLDQALNQAGAKSIWPRLDCDVDYESAFSTWAKELESIISVVSHSPVDTVQKTAASPSIEYGKSNPFRAELLNKILLNGPGSSKETIHLELSLEGSNLEYEAGDALALIPENDPALVEEILANLNLSGSEPIIVNGREIALLDALTKDFDVTTLSKAIASKLATASDHHALKQLVDNEDLLKLYVKDRQLIDLLIDYPLNGLNAADFVACLRKMPPRLYSIASSLRVHPGEVHLTIGAVRYELHGRPRKGVASTYCADQLKIGDKVQVYVQKNKNFRLPEDPKTPIIMVGPGTGIAPFRSFVEERSTQQEAGESWLFFGDQRYLFDFLYQLEWQDHLAEGRLTRIDVAFSRDQPEKIYVQHQMIKRGAELYQWLEKGAYFYVCGDASRMAGDVHQALVQIYQEHGGLSAEAAEAKLTEMKKARRYQRDVY